MNYYNNNKLSQSKLKVFLDSKEKYFYRFIQNNYINNETDSLGFGRFYHTLVFQPELINDKYIVNSGFTINGNMGVFIKEYYNNHIVNKLTEEVSKQKAYIKSEFKLPIETIWKKFISTEDPKNILYYKYLKTTKNKESIDQENYIKGQRMLETLNKDIETINIISPEDILGNNIEIYNELVIDWEVSYSSIQLKSMLDRVIVNHHLKTVTIVDLKTTKCSNIKSFKYDIINYKYYIQAIFYINALEYNILNDSKWSKLKDYKIDFIFIPQYTELPYNTLRPIRLSIKDLEKGYIEYRNGIIELELCTNTNIWKSDDNHTDIKGIITLNLFNNYDNNNS